MAIQAGPLRDPAGYLNLFAGDGLLDGGHDVGGAEAVLVHQEVLGTHLTELVLHAHKFLYGGGVPGQAVGHNRTQAAGDVVVLGGDDGTGFFRTPGRP